MQLVFLITLRGADDFLPYILKYCIERHLIVLVSLV